MSISSKHFDFEGFAHTLLSNRMITFLLTFLVVLMISSAIAMFYTLIPIGSITSNYPFGFLQVLPLVFWAASILYSILGFLVLTSKNISRFNQGYLLLVFLMMLALKVVAQNLITKNPVAGDSYWHYWYAETIISHGYVVKEFYWVWPGQHIFTAILKMVSNLDPIYILIVLPMFMLVLVALFMYLIASRLFGQRTAFLSLFILTNLASPLGDIAMHLSPYMMSTLLAVVVIYNKVSVICSKGNPLKYTALGLIILSILIPTHLLSPLFAGLFLLGIYIINGRLISTTLKWINQYRALKYLLLVLLVIVSLVLIVQRYHFPALLVAFLFGIYISRSELVRLILKSIHNRIMPKHLSMLFIPVICVTALFLFLKHSYITSLFTSFFIGIYVSGNMRFLPTCGRVNVYGKLFKAEAKRIQRIYTLIVVIFVYVLFWWMTRDPGVFIAPVTVIKTLITQYRIDFIDLAIPSRVIYTEAFRFSWIWSFALDSILMIMMFVGGYLSWKYKTYERTRYTLLVGGIAVLLITLYLLTIFAAFPARLNPWITLFGVIAVSVAVKMCYGLGLKKFSLIMLAFIIALMSLSPIGTYTPQAQARLIYDQDNAMSKIVADKALGSNPNVILTGDYRYLYMVQYERADSVRISDTFLESIRNKNKVYRRSDYVLLSLSTPHRMIYRGIDPPDLENKMIEMQHDPSINRIYDNGYNFLQTTSR